MSGHGVDLDAPGLDLYALARTLIAECRRLREQVTERSAPDPEGIVEALRVAEWALSKMLPPVVAAMAKGAYFGCDPGTVLANVRAALARYDEAQALRAQPAPEPALIQHRCRPVQGCANCHRPFPGTSRVCGQPPAAHANAPTQAPETKR